MIAVEYSLGVVPAVRSADSVVELSDDDPDSFMMEEM